MKTKDDIIKYLRKDGVSGVLAERMNKLISQFATVDGFFSASQGDIMKAYSRIAPLNKHGLGRSFWSVFDKANAFYRGFDGKSKDVEDKKDHVEERPSFDPEILRMMSLDELKTVVAFMELCDVEEINIVEITGFMKSVKMRQKKTNKTDCQDCEEAKDDVR